jgi:hypothetical protein
MKCVKDGKSIMSSATADEFSLKTLAGYIKRGKGNEKTKNRTNLSRCGQ